MTDTAAITSEMDHLDQLGAKAFDGFLVRKDLVRSIRSGVGTHGRRTAC